MHLLLNALAFTISSVLLVEAGQLDTAFRWKYVDFVWPSAEARERALQTGGFNLTGSIPMDVDVARDGRVFVTFLNLQGGTPVRLGYVSNLMGPSGPLVQPYPDWGWFQREDCDTSILEVYRIAIDECNRLWVLDTGHFFGQGLKCAPKLLAFDLATNTLLTRVTIPRKLALDPKLNVTLLANVVVETSGRNCEVTNVYMGDANSNILIFWNGARLYRLESPAFLPEQENANVTIAGSTLPIGAGIVGMSISPRIFPNEPRLLYFRPIASLSLYNIDTRSIKLATSNRSLEIYGKKNVLTSQSIGQAFSSEGTLFLSPTKEIAIACWNRYKKLEPDNIEIIAQDDERLQYANGVKVIASPFLGVEELWVVTNRYPAFCNAELDFDEFNFHVLRAPVKSLITGTKCEPTAKVAAELLKQRPNPNAQWGGIRFGYSGY